MTKTLTRKAFIVVLAALGLLAAGCSSASDTPAQAPAWLESDSAQAIHARMLRDFPYTLAEGAQLIIDKHPGLTVDSVREFARKHYVEVRDIDGVERMHRRSIGNVELLNPAYNGGWKRRGWDASDMRIAYADSIIRWTKGQLSDGGAHRVKLRFTIDVPTHPAIAGDTLRVWMPYPLESERQSDIVLVSTYPQQHIISEPEQSVHRSIYFEQPVSEDSATHFEYVVEFTTQGAYYSPQQILNGLKPYDRQSDIYNRYTAFDSPHIVRLDSLARAIVGDETNPYRCSELVYDYIINRYPWAGAREYSTLPCIPQYVIDEGHGDCGQVALLYISLMRTLGIPSRWESGWMLHPGEKNLHDWAETYYEGIGWVPVDVSFGRYSSQPDQAIEHFYSTGIDSYRFAANKGVGGEFYPPKRYLRSETVDAQLGEVETTRGNLFYPAWDQHLQIISSKPISK